MRVTINVEFGPSHLRSIAQISILANMHPETVASRIAGHMIMAANAKDPTAAMEAFVSSEGMLAVFPELEQYREKLGIKLPDGFDFTKMMSS